ncbi:MAG: hypothetical protein ACUVX8_11085 [Candidatus Zipacnadales bacterium]
MSAIVSIHRAALSAGQQWVVGRSNTGAVTSLLRREIKPVVRSPVDWEAGT